MAGAKGPMSAKLHAQLMGLPEFMTETGTFARVVRRRPNDPDDDLVFVTIWSDQHSPKEVAAFLKECAVPTLTEACEMCYKIGTAEGVNYMMREEDVEALKAAMVFFDGAQV